MGIPSNPAIDLILNPSPPVLEICTTIPAEKTPGRLGVWDALIDSSPGDIAIMLSVWGVISIVVISLKIIFDWVRNV